MTRIFSRLAAVAVAGALVTLPTMAGGAAQMGELKNVKAWLNVQPGSPPRLHVQGTVTAPTPCYKATASRRDGEAGQFVVAVTLQEEPQGMCAQVLTDISFRFRADDADTSIETVEVVSDSDRKRVSVLTAH